MKILVIGSKGFIGSNICKYYSSSKQVELWECDVLTSSIYTDNYFYVNASQPKYETIFKKQQFDICINASGSGNVSLSFNAPLNDFILNSFNVCKILDAIRLNNPKCKFVNFSSAAVYGNPSQLPIAENYEIKPLSPYGFHKSVTEKLCTEYYYFFKIRTCSLRVFSAYGPGLRKQLFWDIFQKSKAEGNLIELFGTGNETRDFIYIDDLCESINDVINNAPFKGECVNIASGIETDISTAADCLIQYLYPDKKIQFNGQSKKGDPLNWKADISYLKKFGFSPKISIKDGLLKYAEWVTKNQL